MAVKGRSERLWFIVLMLFIPFILNISISTLIAFITIRSILAEGRSISEAGLEIARNIYTYNFYWSIIQVGMGLYLAKIMGGRTWLKDQFTFKDFTSKPVKSVLLILALFLIAYVLIFCESIVSANLYGGWERYMEYWRRITHTLPLWSKAYMVLIAPFTAGIFEEIIWRGYGINKLEQHVSTRKAVVVQAIAFGFWHGISIHTLITFLIGLVYGFIYAKRRKLLNISIAHIVTDIIGFYFAFMT